MKTRPKILYGPPPFQIPAPLLEELVTALVAHDARYYKGRLSRQKAAKFIRDALDILGLFPIYAKGTVMTTNLSRPPHFRRPRPA